MKSSKGDQFALFSLVGMTGMPKYVMGKFSYLHCRTLKMKGFTFPKGKTKLLWKLILSPNQTSKYRKLHWIIMASLMSFWAKIKVSSAYYVLRDVSERESGKPDKSPAFFEFSVILCNPSTIRINKRGETGSPCLRLLLQAISFPGVPLTNTWILAGFNHSLI